MPKVILKPAFAATLKELLTKCKGKNKINSVDSLLIVEKGAEFENFELDGAVRVTQRVSGSYINEKPEVVPTGEHDTLFERIRGFKHTVFDFTNL
mmetsp:Transcript_5996/g.3396  ORF Transcript_5996/g.3396 Transcript_5996/m.3396 type:complete len:95 (+) Transcript_5996:523-807(+)